jgi:hypothetical protein
MRHKGREGYTKDAMGTNAMVAVIETFVVAFVLSW